MYLPPLVQSALIRIVLSVQFVCVGSFAFFSDGLSHKLHAVLSG